MVARINTSKSISNTLNYNEQKIKSDKAELLFASGYIKRAEKMSYADKIRQFERYTSLNERARTNTMHISLNFDPADNLSKEKLTAIAEQYMEGIGFGHQPYLVYRHFDAAHPHIHIVSINIQKDGSQIPLYNLGRNQSEKTRKEIEIGFGLKKAEKRSQQISQNFQTGNAQKISYGKYTTKKAISHVLQEVISHYRFSSLPEFNAILKLFNVMADRGRADSDMFKFKGLIYRVLDERGKPKGCPIKASTFFHRPTLPLLEKKFIENESLKQSATSRFKVEIEFALSKARRMSLPSFMQELEKSQISAVIQQNKEGMIYGVMYVDHKTKTVFNGTDLGKQYAPIAILERLGLTETLDSPIANKALIQNKQPVYLEEQFEKPEKIQQTLFFSQRSL